MNGFIETLRNGASTLAMLASLSVSTPAPPPPEASLAEIQSLEHKVQQGDGPSVLPYLRKRLLRDHPELRAPNGQPKFIVGFIGESSFTPQTINKALTASLPIPHDWGFSDKMRGNLSYIHTSVEVYQDAVSMIGKPVVKEVYIGARTSSLEITRTSKSSAQTSSFSILSLNPNSCPSCSRNWDKDPRTCSTQSVASIRNDQLINVENAEHESAHMLSAQLGLRSNRARLHPNNPRWEQLAEENFAYTYGALRMLQIFGEEGAAHVQSRLRNSIYNLSNGNLDAWNTVSLHNVIEYWEKNPNLRNIPTKDIPALATRLMAPPTPEQIKSLENLAKDPQRLSGSHISAEFRKLARSGNLAAQLQRQDAEQHNRYYYLYALSYKTDIDTFQIELNRLNPQRPASFPANFLFDPMTTPLTPQQRKDLERLNAPNRAPHCPAPKFD